MSNRILILTAAFGEGHNSAARNLSRALGSQGIENQVTDPCMIATPVSTRWICKGYRLITTHFPRLWEKVYRTTAHLDFSKQRMPLMRKPERYLDRLVNEYQPTAIVSTYPIYPYFLGRSIGPEKGAPPVFTVVTDSIEINTAWLNCPTAAWFVTDAFTRAELLSHGLDDDKVIDTGFPVHPEFAALTPISAEAEIAPFDVLYFATAKLPQVRRIALAVLEASPTATITIVLGKNVRQLVSRAREIKRRFPGRVRIRGWTKRVPKLLTTHHLVIGKAGGATVHEAIAACCPMLVHHLVPGQEEGNLRLLEKVGGGSLAEGEDQIKRKLAELLAADGKQWREMKKALFKHDRNAGAISTATEILRRIDPDHATRHRS